MCCACGLLKNTCPHQLYTTEHSKGSEINSIQQPLAWGVVGIQQPLAWGVVGIQQPLAWGVGIQQPLAWGVVGVQQPLAWGVVAAFSMWCCWCVAA
jgi:hypothetical protein